MASNAVQYRVRLTCTVSKIQVLEKALWNKRIPPPLCRACRPTPRHHSARTANRQSCAKWRSWRRSRVVAPGYHEAYAQLSTVMDGLVIESAGGRGLAPPGGARLAA